MARMVKRLELRARVVKVEEEMEEEEEEDGEDEGEEEKVEMEVIEAAPRARAVGRMVAAKLAVGAEAKAATGVGMVAASWVARAFVPRDSHRRCTG